MLISNRSCKFQNKCTKSIPFFKAYLQINALFRLMETEVVSMTAAMLNGNSEVVGFLTSGGTESNLMAVKTFRDMALATRTNIRKPNIVSQLDINLNL